MAFLTGLKLAAHLTMMSMNNQMAQLPGQSWPGFGGSRSSFRIRPQNGPHQYPHCSKREMMRRRAQNGRGN